MAEIIIIRESDLDAKTVKVVDGKVAAPGAEIEVLDSFEKRDTDTHYYEGSTKFLKHVETGTVWQAEIGKMKKRAAPRNEELTPESTAVFFKGSEDNQWDFNLTSAISGNTIYTKPQQAGNYTENTGIFAQYANAKEANAALANEKLTFTTNEYFADNVDGKPKILATTLELPYPALPYKEGKADAKLVAQSFDGSVDLQFADSVLSSKQNSVKKTYHYKFVSVTGQEYEGTFKTTANSVSVEKCEPSLEWYQIARATYSVEPFNVEYFFGNEEVAPDAVTVENLVDNL